MDKKMEVLFVSYLEKTITEKDENKLVQWISGHPKSINELNDLRLVWNISELVGSYDQNFLDEEWTKLLLKVKKANGQNKKPSGLFLFWLPRIAAVFIFGAAISFFITYKIIIPSEKQIAFNEINIPAGAKSKVTLPDGTNVFLNAGSTLKYSSRFGEKNREVYLTGEAYFDVETDPSKIFLVQTSELNIKAYGTTFNVKSYPEENTIETTLIEGSIGVTRTRFEEKANDEVVLEPNQRVVYFRKTKSIETVEDGKIMEELRAEPVKRKQEKLTYLISKGIEPEEFTSWKDGTLFITSETLNELAIKIERKYDVKIHFQNDKIRNLKFTGSLENETVEQVIEAIGIAAQIEYEITDRDIWLKGQTN